MGKKSFVFNLLALVTLIIFTTSCSKKVEYVNVIPSDAAVVVSVDLKSIVSKSGFTDKINEPIQKKMLDALKNGLGAKSFGYMEKVIKNPSELGLSVNDKIYFFAYMPNYKLGMAAKVTDIDKLKEAFKLLADEQACSALTETNGYYQATVADKSICAFNETSLLILEANDAASNEKVAALMTQKKENSINSNNGFRKMTEEDGDIAAYFSFSSIPDIYLAQIKNALPKEINPTDISFLSTLNFDKGRIAIEGEMYSDNKIVTKWMEDSESKMSKLNSTFLNYFPATSLAYMSFNTNYLSTYNMLGQGLESLGLEIDAKQLLASIDGDIAVALTSLNAQGEPSITAYIEAKDDYLLQTTAAFCRSMSIGNRNLIENGEKNYIYKNGNTVVYFGMQKKHFYVTNDANIYKNINKKVDNSMADALWKSEAKKSCSFMVVNMQEVLANPMFGTLMAMGGKEAEVIKIVMGECSYMDMSIPAFNKAKINIVLKDTKENVLSQIVKGISKTLIK
ncbi:MAG: DUF4836 family protein [Bacteroides sp.]